MRAAALPAGGSSGATRQILAAVAMAAMLCGAGIAHVFAKVSAVEAGYELGQLEDTHRQLERENASLKLQLATLRSAAHIETTARTQLGMTAPAPQMVFPVGGPLATAAAPTPATSKPASHKPLRASKPHAGVVGPSGTPVALLAPR
ncbi:MAG: cell division protein FtsL [Deltaproteobacteria bacterium]|nr:cell division protein FtsL [Deltaproteobacteria bacterium]